MVTLAARSMVTCPFARFRLSTEQVPGWHSDAVLAVPATALSSTRMSTSAGIGPIGCEQEPAATVVLPKLNPASKFPACAADGDRSNVKLPDDAAPVPTLQTFRVVGAFRMFQNVATPVPGRTSQEVVRPARLSVGFAPFA